MIRITDIFNVKPVADVFRVWATVAVSVALVWFLGSTQARASYSANIPIDWGSTTSISTVESDFESALSAAGLGNVGVTITGATVGTNITNENYVVGAVSGTTVTPYTLVSEDGGSLLETSSSMTITFSTALPITSISFDYEIFPDVSGANSCTSLSNCGKSDANLPDLTVTDGSNTIFQRYAEPPGTSLGTINACPSSGSPPAGTDCGGGGSTVTEYDHSIHSHYNHEELAPQLLGTSGTVAMSLPAGSQGVTTLTFNDWPATIAITNLIITAQVPEPGSLCIVLSGLIGMAMLRRRKHLR